MFITAICVLFLIKLWWPRTWIRVLWQVTSCVFGQSVAFDTVDHGNLLSRFTTGFAKNGSLYRQMSTKYKSSKLFWRILEDNKQNKRENWSKETLRICACKSPIAELCATCSWNGDDFLPVLPSLRFSPSNSCLFWWSILANSCLLVSNSIFFFGNRGNKA